MLLLLLPGRHRKHSKIGPSVPACLPCACMPKTSARATPEICDVDVGEERAARSPGFGQEPKQTRRRETQRACPSSWTRDMDLTFGARARCPNLCLPHFYNSDPRGASQQGPRSAKSALHKALSLS